MAKSTYKLPVLDKEGKKSADYQLKKEIFGLPVNPQLIAQTVKVYLNNQRSAYPNTKKRGEVSGSGKKIWPQKGTGRARHGDQYAPIFVGGGVAHGPKGNQVYKKKLPKKMKKSALKSVLSAKQEEGRIKVVKGIKRLRKTSSAHQYFKLWFGKDFDPNKKYLLLLPLSLNSAKKAFRNLPYLDIVIPDVLNAYQVINHDWLICTPDSLKELEKRLLK
jgi:large subunit ribosomal protein L4